MKRSNEPIVWSLFGAGGMLSALVGPVLILLTGILVPAGIGFSRDTLDYEHVHAFASHGLGKVVLVAVISLFLWHAMHRIFHPQGLKISLLFRSR